MPLGLSLSRLIAEKAYQTSILKIPKSFPLRAECGLQGGRGQGAGGDEEKRIEIKEAGTTPDSRPSPKDFFSKPYPNHSQFSLFAMYSIIPKL